MLCARSQICTMWEMCYATAVAGLTPVDVAINNKQVLIVRRLEQGAAFAGWLTQKVTK